MARSTPIMLAVGGVAIAHHVLNPPRTGISPGDILLTTTATAIAALAAAALDAAIPGLGTGTAALALVVVVLAYGPDVFEEVLSER